MKLPKIKIFHSTFNRSGWGNFFVFMFLAFFGVFFMFPIFYSVLNAFKPLEEIMIFPPRLYIKNPTLDNFLELAMLMEQSWVPLSRYLFNSILISVVHKP